MSASIIALYEILGYPSDHCPDCVSWDKFTTQFDYIRKTTGFDINTRRLTFAMSADKRTQLIAMLAPWPTKLRMTLLEAAELLGTLGDACRACRWARTRFCALQNYVNNLLRSRYHTIVNVYKRTGKALVLKKQLPQVLLRRLPILVARVAREMAQLLWSTNQSFLVPKLVQLECQFLNNYLVDRTNLWEMQIGHFIPREPSFTSAGDSSLTGGELCPTSSVSGLRLSGNPRSGDGCACITSTLSTSTSTKWSFS